MHISQTVTRLVNKTGNAKLITLHYLLFLNLYYTRCPRCRAPYRVTI